MYSRAN
jgi:hypothetical protein